MTSANADEGQIVVPAQGRYAELVRVLTPRFPRSAATVLEILRHNGHGNAWVGKTHLCPLHEVTLAGPLGRPVRTPVVACVAALASALRTPRRVRAAVQTGR